MTWAPNSEGDLLGYRIYRLEGGTQWVLRGEVAHDASHFTHTGLPERATYTYAVSAFDASNESALSASAAARRHTWCFGLRTLILGIVVVLGVMPAASCERIDRGRQIRAQAALQFLSEVVERHRDRTGFLPGRSGLEFLVEHRRLTDPWGTPIQYEVFGEADRTRYVLVSVGADRKLDVGRLQDYLVARPEIVANEPAKDIVVVDGIFVRNAGK